MKGLTIGIAIRSLAIRMTLDTASGGSLVLTEHPTLSLSSVRGFAGGCRRGVSFLESLRLKFCLLSLVALFGLLSRQTLLCVSFKASHGIFFGLSLRNVMIVFPIFPFSRTKIFAFEIHSCTIFRSFEGDITSLNSVEDGASDRDSQEKIAVIESRCRELQIVQQRSFEEFFLDIEEMLE